MLNTSNIHEPCLLISSILSVMANYQRPIAKIKERRKKKTQPQMYVSAAEVSKTQYFMISDIQFMTIGQDLLTDCFPLSILYQSFGEILRKGKSTAENQKTKLALHEQ